MRRGLRLFKIATRYGLVEHARNRFAMLLVAVFLPVWVTMTGWAVTKEPVQFRLHSTSHVLTADGDKITQITGALNGVTLIIGFMMFAATFSNGAFDRRLSMAGFPRVPLGLAKVACLVIASVAVCSYATAVICCFWSPRQPVLLGAALFGTAMTYGALGVALGTLLRREVEGMFAIVMISVVDLGLQNPLASGGADSGMVRWLPSYGGMQTATAAGFSATVSAVDFAVQLAWFTAVGLIGLLAFYRRTRSALAAAVRIGRQADDGPVPFGRAANR